MSHLVLFVVFSLVVTLGNAAPFNQNMSQSLNKSKPDIVSNADFTVYGKPRNNKNNPQFAKDRILVRFKTNVSLFSQKSVLQKIPGATLGRKFALTKDLHVVQLSGNASINSALAAFRLDPNVKYAEPDYKINFYFEPDDTSFNQQWALNNVGQSGGTVDADINAPEGWTEVLDSSAVVVAVIDTGVEYLHEDLKDNMWINTAEFPADGVDSDGNGYIDDIHGINPTDQNGDPSDYFGHGTHVAGTISASGNNNKGVSGVNLNAKILACRVGGLSNDAWVSDVIACLDYIHDLKLAGRANIIASNNSWGINQYSSALYDAIKRQMEVGILFIAAAGNGGVDSVGDNNNNNAIYPANYDLPNVISVAATDRRDSLTSFSNYGHQSVHVAAPGHEILNTVPGLGAIVSEVYMEDVESGEGDWSIESPWSIVNKDFTHVWTDSPEDPNEPNVQVNYADNANIALTSPTINLTDIVGDIYLTFRAKFQLEFNYDFVFVEFTNDTGGSWIRVGAMSGETGNWVIPSYRIPENMRTDQFQFRFNLISDELVTGDGIYIDDIGIGIGIPDQYETMSGTSMATPHVTGLAALIKAQDPARDWLNVRNLILSGGSQKIGLQDKIVTGRRIKTASNNGDGSGSLTCLNQEIVSRITPATANYDSGNETVFIATGQSVQLSALHINCENTAGELSISASSGQSIVLKDDGLVGDKFAGDGVYSSVFEPNDGNVQSLTFPNNDIVNLVTLTPYESIVPQNFEWRNLSSSATNIADLPNSTIYNDIARTIILPFPIKFGNNSEFSFDRIIVSDNGVMSFTDIVEGVDSALPAKPFSTIVAPYWKDLIFDVSSGDGIYVQMLGKAPFRELVIEWRNAYSIDILIDSPNPVDTQVTFQVVFFEFSPNILFNYKDVTLDSGYGGILNTNIGMQYSRSVGQQMDFNTSRVGDNTSFLWSASDKKKKKKKKKWFGSFDFGFLVVMMIWTIAYKTRHRYQHFLKVLPKN